MSIKAHVEAVFWPNGLGETPCTQEYKALLDEQNALRDKYTDILTGIQEFVDDWSNEDYNRFHQIANDLGVLQLDGHLGKGFKYEVAA